MLVFASFGNRWFWLLFNDSPALIKRRKKAWKVKKKKKKKVPKRPEKGS